MAEPKNPLTTFMLLGDIFISSLSEKDQKLVRRASEAMVDDLCRRAKADFERDEKLKEYERKREEELKPLSVSFGDLLAQAKKDKKKS